MKKLLIIPIFLTLVSCSTPTANLKLLVNGAILTESDWALDYREVGDTVFFVENTYGVFKLDNSVEVISSFSWEKLSDSSAIQPAIIIEKFE